MKINNDLIEMIRNINKMSDLINSDQLEIEKIQNLSNFDEIQEYDIKDTLNKINDRIDKTEQLVHKIMEIEPNEYIRTLYLSLVKYIELENYEKCHEISKKIKNYNM